MNKDTFTKDLLDFFFRCSDSMQTFWNFYIAVVVGVIVFFASLHSQNTFLTCAMTLGFIVFATVNLSGLHDLTLQRIAAATQVKKNAENDPEDIFARLYKNSLNPPPFYMVRIVHILLDIIVIAIIWSLKCM